ncbi:beta-ketoacyl-ACP synthase III [candidate division KSB1 bacterium]
MSKLPIAYIAGTGHAVPETILTNADLEKMVETSDEWITSRTGIKQRHISKNGQLTSDISAQAAQYALEDAGVTPEEIDVIILGTVSGDADFPATACYVQDKIGAVNASAFDISAACSGFVYALSLANTILTDGFHENILVIGAETLSRITNWKDRNSCVLFGDGAGAVVVKKTRDEKGILSFFMKSDGRLSHLLMNPGHRNGKVFKDPDGNRIPPYIYMQGREVFKHAVRSMEEACAVALERADKSIDQVNLLIPHQANIRIIESLAARVNIEREKVYVNVDRYGNTSAGSIPIALDEARKTGKLKEGDLCLMTVFGGGFTWGSALVQF